MQARDLLSIAVATATFAMGTTAFADDDRRGGGRRHHDGPRVEHRHMERHTDRRYHHPGPRVVHREVRIVHPGPRWARGHYVPPEYRHGRYVVRHHNPRLYTPPRGHHWIQVNGDFLLVAAATGLIAHVLLNQ
jgi:Ni/Co efflux regulator RcnB